MGWGSQRHSCTHAPSRVSCQPCLEMFAPRLCCITHGIACQLSGSGASVQRQRSGQCSQEAQYARCHIVRSQREAHLFKVPASTFKEDTMHVCTLLWRRRHLGRLQVEHAILEAQRVDRDAVLAGGRLQHRSEEAGGVREAREPVDGGVRVFHPAGELIDAEQEVARPAAQRLEGGVRLEPEGRHLACEEGVEHKVEVCRHPTDSVSGAQRYVGTMRHSTHDLRRRWAVERVTGARKRGRPAARMLCCVTAAARMLR